MHCPICEKELDSSLTSCPFCGTPIKEVSGAYVKSEVSFIDTSKTKKSSKERAHEELIKTNRTIAGITSLLAFPLMLGAIAFFVVAFITFNPGTPEAYSGIVYTPYSLCFLVPSFIMAIVAFFKSKDTNFKSANRLAFVEVLINGLLTLIGFILLILYTANAL